MKKTYEIGELCYRCGISRQEFKEWGFGCESWGAAYPRHLWNDKQIIINEFAFPAPSPTK